LDNKPKTSPMRKYVVVFDGVGNPIKVYTKDNLNELWEVARKGKKEYIKTGGHILLTNAIVAIFDDFQKEIAEDAYSKQFKEFDTDEEGKVIIPVGLKLAGIGGN